MGDDAAAFPTTEATEPDSSSSVDWTVGQVFLSLGLFVLAGIAEVGGGWLVWGAVRESKPWWCAVLGSVVLVGYGFIPTLQPSDSFGRVYAVYGGFFIALSYTWGWIFDGDKPDVGATGEPCATGVRVH